MERFATIITEAVKHCCKVLHLRYSRGSDYASTISMLHFSMLHFFHVAFFHVSLFPCCTFSIRTFFMLHFFQVALVSCCTFCMSHFSHVALFHVTIMLHSFLFPCCALFMLHLLIIEKYWKWVEDRKCNQKTTLNLALCTCFSFILIFHNIFRYYMVLNDCKVKSNQLFIFFKNNMFAKAWNF